MAPSPVANCSCSADFSPHHRCRRGVHIFSRERETSVRQQYQKFSAKRVAELDGSVSAFSRGLSRVSSLFRRPQRPGCSAQRPGKCLAPFLGVGVACYRRQGARSHTCGPTTTGGPRVKLRGQSTSTSQGAQRPCRARYSCATRITRDSSLRKCCHTRPEFICRTAKGRSRRRAHR